MIIVRRTLVIVILIIIMHWGVNGQSVSPSYNFTYTFSIGFAEGINILYSDRFGFSYDMGPVITTTGGLSKMIR